MFSVTPKDKFSPVIVKNNIFSAIYIPAILYILYLSDNLYKLGKYENLRIVSILTGLEFLKYYFYKNGKVHTDSKLKKKNFKLEKICRSTFFLVQMLVLIYIVSVLLGASFLSNFEQTFMFSCMLTVLAILPVTLFLGIDDIFQLLDVASQAPMDSLNNMVLMQFELTLFGAWLGAIPIPLDWNREWQVWPNSCVLGTFGGYFLANVVSYVMQSSNILLRGKKNARFKNIL